MGKTTATEYGQCTQDAPRPDGAWVGYKRQRCPRKATGPDRLCGVHRAGWNRRQQTDARYEAARAQAAFVAAWRKAHLHRSWLDGWRCPLCNRQVQRGAFRDTDFMRLTIQRHQEGHGQDWLDYLQAGQPAEQRADAR